MIDSGGRRQVFRPGELPLAVLALLEHEDRNAHELMGELGRLFAGRYRPSAGGIYPATAALEKQGLIARSDNDDGRFVLTPLGVEALDRRRQTVAEIELRTGVRFGESGSLNGALDRFEARVRASVGLVEPALVEKILDAAATEIEQLTEREDNYDHQGSNRD